MALEGDKVKNMYANPAQDGDGADITFCRTIEDKESNAETNNMTCTQALCCYISSKCSNNLPLSETNLP